MALWPLRPVVTTRRRSNCSSHNGSKTSATAEILAIRKKKSALLRTLWRLRYVRCDQDKGPLFTALGAEVEPELSWALSCGDWDTDFLKSSHI